MRSLRSKLCEHPALPRVLPFLLYLAFLVMAPVIGQSSKILSTFFPFDERMIYPLKVACIALLLVFFWRRYGELRKFSLQLHEALLSAAVGAGVFLLWVNLDHEWMSIGDTTVYDPRDQSGDINWFLALSRLTGAALVVPIMEELFWRSFLMRWIERPKFLGVSPSLIGPRALLTSSVLFGLGHTLWLAGIVAGLAFGALYILRGKNLWAPVLAHATTNGLLGLWVLQTGRWDFW